MFAEGGGQVKEGGVIVGHLQYGATSWAKM